MNSVMRMIVRYIGLTMAALGVLGLANGRNLPVWLIMLAIGVALVYIAKVGKDSAAAGPLIQPSNQQSLQSNDTITPLHFLAVVTIYAAIPWGIVCLVRKKRRSGWFLILGPFVVGAVAFAVYKVIVLYLTWAVQHQYNQFNQ